MDAVKGIKVTSGDDESILINVSTECIPMDLSQYTAFWELRKTMTAIPDITKVSTSPDLVVDPIENTIVVYLRPMDTSLLFGEYLQYLYLLHKTTFKKTSLIYGPVMIMEGFDTVYPTTTYCTPEDIAMQLKPLNADGSRTVYTETTNPRRSDVIDMIRQAETKFDRDTRNSWRINYVTEEYHDIRLPLAGVPLSDNVISLRNSNIYEIDSTQGDKIEFWNGSIWEDFALMIPSRGHTWWLDKKIGQVHINNLYPWFYTGNNRFRMSYRWGATEVPDDVKEACIKIVSIRLLQSDFNKLYIMNQKPNMDWGAVIEMWTKDIEKTVSNRKRTIFSFVTR